LRIGDGGDLDFGLAHADGFQQDHVVTNRAQQADGRRNRCGQAAEMTSACHRAD
jgi:hypothetical protein